MKQPIISWILLVYGIVMTMPGPRSCALAVLEEDPVPSETNDEGAEISDEGEPDEDDEDEECVDHFERCPFWAHLGECDVNPPMLEYCAKSCEVCDHTDDDEDDQPCVDFNRECRDWAEQGECQSNSEFMQDECRKSCKVCRPLPRRKKSSSDTMTREERLIFRSQKFGKAQELDGSFEKEIVRQLELSIEYMASDSVTNLPIDIKRKCRTSNIN